MTTKPNVLKKIPLFWSPCMLSNETEDGTQYFYQVEQLTFLWILLTLIVIGNATVLIALLLSKADIFAFFCLFRLIKICTGCFEAEHHINYPKIERQIFILLYSFCKYTNCSDAKRKTNVVQFSDIHWRTDCCFLG